LFRPFIFVASTQQKFYSSRSKKAKIGCARQISLRILFIIKMVEKTYGGKGTTTWAKAQGIL